jgi:hypothetical protein
MKPSEIIKEFAKNVHANNWNWGLEEFARRCKLRPDDAYMQKQWKAFKDLHQALYAIDGDVPDVVASPE